MLVDAIACVCVCVCVVLLTALMPLYNVSIVHEFCSDNDVDYIDHSFGFSSAVEAAQVAIRSAKTEAVCNLPNGIGIGT